jgi:hypothetical protein
MKPGVKRDLKFVLALLAVFLLAGGLAWIVAYVNAGPLPADRQARELYAAGARKLIAVFSMVGVGLIAVAYLSSLAWFPRRQNQDQANQIAPAASDACLPSFVGWAVLLGVVVIVAAVLVVAALSGG